MNKWKRIICLFKGHVTLCKPEPIKRLEEKDFVPQGKMGSGIISLNNSAYIGTGITNAVLSIGGENLAGRKFELHICKRCGSIYSKVDNDEKYLADISHYPALKDATKMIQQLAWEKSLQDEYETVANAWKSYQMAIKLCKQKE